MAQTSRTIVRTGVAQFFGGTTFDSTFRAYRNGPLMGAGLSTVRTYQPKRLPDFDYVLGQNPGRGMGAVAILEMPENRNTVATVGQEPQRVNGFRKIVYPVRMHVFHLAHQDYAEDAEQDVDDLIQALEERMYTDPSLGGICAQAGQSEFGIRTMADPSEIWNERLLTHFTFEFDVEVYIQIGSQ